MTALRLLFGTVAGPFGSAADATTLVASPGAAYARGQAFYYAGHSYFAIANNAGGQRVVVYRHSDGTVFNRQLTADGSTPVDSHNNPGLCLRETDNRLFTIRSDHAGDHLYTAVSTDSLDSDPTLANGFGTTTDIDAQVGATNYTYAYPMYAFDRIFVFYRDQDGEESWELTNSASAAGSGTNGGAGWATGVKLLHFSEFPGGPTSSRDASARVVKSSATRLDFACSDANNVYHFYYDGTSFRTSDGTGLAGSPPYTFSQFTKVYDGVAEGAPGIAFSIQKSGASIAITWMTDEGSDDDYWYGLWDGATWTANRIVASVGQGSGFQNGMCFVDPANLSRVVVSRKSGSKFAIYHYTTANGGTSWASEPVLVDASNDVIYPTWVRDHTTGLQWIALSGSVTSQSVFSLGVVGYG